MPVELDIELVEAQFAIWEACLDPDIRTISTLAGRKFGKTYLALYVALYWGLEKNNSLVGYYLPSYPYFRDQVKHEMYKVFPADLLKGGNWDDGYSKSDREITLYNNSRIIFRSMEEPDSARSVSLDALIAEEFSFWSEYAWKECVSSTLMAKQARCLAIFTPKLKNHAYDFHHSEEIDHRAFHYTSYEGYVGVHHPEEIDRLIRQLGSSISATEIYAEWLDNYGKVFDNINNIINDRLPIIQEPVKGRSYSAGIDLGRVDDYTVVTIFDDQVKHGVYQEKFRGIDYVKQSEKLAPILKKYNNANACIDSTGDRGGVYEMLKRKGCRVNKVVYTSKSKPILIDNLRNAISNGDFKIPHWHDTYEELLVYDIQETKSGNITYNAPSGYKDDHVNSLALVNKAMGSSVKKAAPSLAPRQSGGANAIPTG